MGLRKEISPFEQLPRFYGVAYTEFNRDIGVCYPIPLNIVVGLWRKLLWWLRAPIKLGIEGKNFRIIGEDISDGYHTFTELYDHRCLLFINLCIGHPEAAYWRPHYEGWPLIGIETRLGQISYHVPEKYLPLFAGKIRKGGPEWDGHSSRDVIERLRDLAGSP